MRGIPEPLPVEYGKPGYVGRVAKRLERRTIERKLSKVATAEERQRLRALRKDMHWTNRPLGGHL